MFDKYLIKLAASWLQLSVFVMLSCTNSRPLKAQTPNSTFAQQFPPPQDVQPPQPSPSPSPQLPQPLPPPAELLPPSIPSSTPEESLPGKVPQTIIVERFEVIGSTVFSPAELTQATAEFTKRPITLAQVYQARSKITELYINNGYITSGAYIPLQTIQSGVVKIQVLEGKLEDIQITGTQRLNSNYVRSRLEIATSPPLNRQRLLESLQLLQLNPLIKNLSAELSAGSRPGASVLQVAVNEANTFNAQVVLDNGRSPSVGSFRRRLQLNEANFLGLGDGLSLGYTNTDGSNSFDVGYTLPLNPRNGTLSFNYGTTSSNVIEEPFNILDIESSSRYYELTFRQPVIQTPTQEFVLGLTASRRESEATYINFERIAFPSLGADEQGRTKVSALRFFQEWTSRSSREVIALRSQFNLGLGAFDATINKNAPDSRFFSWQGQAQWARLIAPATLLLMRVNTQLTTTEIVPLEQFGIGGQDSVRGYRQDFNLTDNGTFASAEVQVPILRLPETDGILQIVPFADFGIGWNSSNRENLKFNTIASVGLGLRWTQGDRFTVRLDWGIPLVPIDSKGTTWQENGLYFYLLYNPL
ncbi:MAG: ShlB/FhaC/HecB family hemolysin secretion/activation protein [Desmonostoc vinosum HA7617-LM4]|jgi:hemolysin activation/secretion protein|nr:ShlB/FhaC/HecB family hemolysin secretion/activation protein [Desmonostoc vinosum HA7617-LM4]